MIYGWTILKFNYSLPGWLYFLNIGEILSVLAYSMTTNLLESIFVLFGVVAVSVVLPKKWFADAFITRGVILSIFVLGLMMFVGGQFSTWAYYPANIIRWFPAYLVSVGLIAFFAGRIQFVNKSTEFFADRAIIFLYVSIPLSVLSLIAVLIRNII